MPRHEIVLTDEQLRLASAFLVVGGVCILTGLVAGYLLGTFDAELERLYEEVR